MKPVFKFKDGKYVRKITNVWRDPISHRYYYNEILDDNSIGKCVHSITETDFIKYVSPI